MTTAPTRAVRPDTLVGDLVTDEVTRTRILDRHGIDYCCGGRRTLAQACAESGADLDEVIAQLSDVDRGPAPDWTTMPLAELARHIVEVHHAYLWDEMPRLQTLVDKVAGVHGERHPELASVRAAYGELVADLSAHLTKEERILFPAIEAFLSPHVEAPAFPFGRLANPIRMMLAEHDVAGELLARMRADTDGFAVPDDACGSYRAMLAGLAELEDDIHLHIHKENNVLFPQVVELEEDLLGPVA